MESIVNAGLPQQAVDELFAERIERGLAPGSIYAVFDRSGILFTNGFGKADESGRPPTLDTAFRIASCTKSFTAATVLLLRDRGLLSLDDSIKKYATFGNLAMPTPDSGAPTIGMLASMSGGLPTDDPWADRQESIGEADLDRLLEAGIKFITTPGTAYEYSNLGFALLGRVIEVVTGRSYVDVVTDEILTPLGLTGLGFDTGVSASDGLATGYRKLRGEWQSLPFSGPGAFSPIGGLFSTPRALVRWASWLAAGFQGSDDSDVPLSSLTRREMQQMRRAILPQSMDSGVVGGYGYGLFVDHGRHGLVVSHSGGYPGFSSHMRWHAASGVGIVAFENAKYSGAAGPAAAALELILDASNTPEAEFEIWPETLAARAAVELLLHDWDDAIATALFADNVVMDDSFEDRRAEISSLVAQVGLKPGHEVPLRDARALSESRAHLAWTIPGIRGGLRCEIRLTPQNPPRVQTLTVRTVDFDDGIN